jgi:hypothetical protein
MPSICLDRGIGHGMREMGYVSHLQMHIRTPASVKVGTDAGAGKRDVLGNSQPSLRRDSIGTIVDSAKAIVGLRPSFSAHVSGFPARGATNSHVCGFH